MKDFKQTIKNGEVAFGIWVVSSSPHIVEMVGYAGFDFVMIDTEHAGLSPYGLEFENCIRAAYAADITPLARPTWNDPGQIKKILNTGAKGIMPPHINTKEDAELLVRSAKFAPAGRRSCAPVVRAAKHGFTNWQEFWRKSNEEILVMPIIEEKEAIDNLEEIISVEGIDGVNFGPFDYSMSVGLDGKCEDPLIWKTLEKIVRICRPKGMTVGNLAWNMESAKKSIDLGAQYICYSTDVTIVRDTLRQLAETVNKEIRPIRFK
jgi:4-hydroxy-2-oxoheptanedioate aldolase